MPNQTTQKSILEETFAEIASIKESLTNNASLLINGNLKSEMQNIISTAIKEAKEIDDFEDPENDPENETGEQMPEIPSNDTDVSGEPENDVAGDISSTDVGLDGADDMPTDEIPPIDEPEMGDEEIVDLTGASDEDVLSVFKKMGPEDEIEVIQTPDGNIEIKLGGEEYIIKTGGEGETLPDNLDVDDSLPTGDDDIPADIDNELVSEADYKQELSRVKQMGNNGGSGDRTDVKAAKTADVAKTGESSSIDDNTQEGADKRSDVKKPKEIAVATIGKGGQNIDKNVTKNFEHGKTDKRTDVSKPAEIAVAKVTPTSGTMSMETSNTPNYDRGTKNTPTNANPTVNSKTTVGIAEANQLKKKLQENHEKLVYTRQKYAEAVTDNANLRDQINQLNENIESFKTSEDGYKSAIQTLREQFGEVALFTSNLTYAVKLMTEHATTKEEKTQILDRFDKATTLSESKVIYESIAASFGQTKKVAKNIDEQLNRTATSGASAINESTAYQSPDLARMKDLMKKMK